ncbi:unnamed protein product [Prunus brigantina]
MISSCPHHNIETWMQMQSFYEGLLDSERMMVEATSGEGLMNKTADEAFTLFESLSANSQQWSHSKGRGAPMKAVVSEVKHMLEQANALQARDPNNDPYSNTYNPGWRNHPNFKWSNNSNVQQPQGPPPGFQIQQRQFQQAPQQVQEQRGDQMGELQDMFKKFMGQQMQTNQNLQNAVNKLEVQVGQIASSLSNRASGTFPSQTEVGDENEEQEDGKNVETIQPPQGQPTASNKQPLNASGKSTGPKVSSNANQVPISTNAFRPIAPFPSRLSNSKKDQGLDEIMETFRRCKSTSHCSMLLLAFQILQRKLPPKLKDPGSFSIPCMVGDFKIPKALLDLGASINLMPYHVYEKLNLGELQATTVSIQLADRTIRYPKGILEDVLVNVEGLILPADFLVLEMEEAPIPDNELPLILGRPFMATAKTKIDVEQGTLTMTVNGETVAFKVFNAPKPNVLQDCFQIEVSLEDYAQPIIPDSPSCILLSIEARNYDLKSSHFHMLPSFYGLPNEDPLAHIKEFYNVVSGLPLRGAMLDLGASINLMPYSVYLQLGLGELKATTISLQLADRSVKYPRGIVEDILVQVDKLILPADFVVLDMEEAPIHDRELPILLGRPFMATAKTIIDVQNGLLTMTVLGETVQFKVFESLSHPSSSFDCCSIDVLDSIVFSKFLLAQSNDPLQYVLSQSRTTLMKKCS